MLGGKWKNQKKKKVTVVNLIKKTEFSSLKLN